MPRQGEDEFNWFALAVRPRHEKKVAVILEGKGYEVFVPLYGPCHRSGRSRNVRLPVFPGYIFSQFDLHRRLPVLTTPGVVQILGTGKTPVPVEETEITSMRIAADRGFDLKPAPYLRTGHRVRIKDGPLAGIEGVVVRTEKPLRVLLSVTLMQRSVLLETNSDSLAHVDGFEPARSGT